MGVDALTKILNFSLMADEKIIKEKPYKKYVVLKDFTLDKSYQRGATISLNDEKVAQSLINQKYIK